MEGDFLSSSRSRNTKMQLSEDRRSEISFEGLVGAEGSRPAKALEEEAPSAQQVVQREEAPSAADCHETQRFSAKSTIQCAAFQPLVFPNKVQFSRAASVDGLEPAVTSNFSCRANPEAPTTVDGTLVAFFDVETTGLDSNARLVELACSAPGAGEFSLVINPEIPIDSRATRVHGLSASDVLLAPTAGEALLAWRAWLTCAARGRSVALVAHNGFRFDFRVLQRELERCAVGFSIADLATWCNDSLVASRLRSESKVGHSLRALHLKLLGCEPPNAHSALADCRALAAVCSKGLPGPWGTRSEFCRSASFFVNISSTGHGAQPTPQVGKRVVKRGRFNR